MNQGVKIGLATEVNAKKMQNKIFRLFRASDLAFGGLNSRYVYACKWAEIEEGRAGGWGLDERRMPISFLT